MWQVILRVGAFVFKAGAFLLFLQLLYRSMSDGRAVLLLFVLPPLALLIAAALETIANTNAAVEELQEQLADSNKRIMWLQKKLSDQK